MFSENKQISILAREDALPGREQKMRVPTEHFVNGNPLVEPFPDRLSRALFGMGCFWGAEKKFWQEKGVYSTAVGYASGYTENPSYQEVCTGMTGHNEVVLVIFDESICSYEHLLKVFYENHNPTQGMQQGHDVGSQYRSGIYFYTDKQREQAEKMQMLYQSLLNNQNLGDITTEIIMADIFYYAEEYHQQYLAKNVNGYCGLGGTGVKFQV